MASEVSICNQALSWLGANLITSLDDDSIEASLCKTNYAALRDAVMEDVPWTFATLRAMLTPETETPAYGYAQQFLIPSRFLRILEVRTNANQANGATVFDFRVEGDKILCNAKVIYVKVIQQITAPEKFSSSFVQALAARIATDIALPVTNSVDMMKTMFSLYQQKLSDAATLDGMQGKSDIPEATRLLRTRYGGSGYISDFQNPG